MGQPSLDSLARRVLDRYPLSARDLTLIPLGNGGGFSGARLWRVEGPAGQFCLRAGPPGNLAAERLHTIHHWMNLAGAAELSFVPRVLTNRMGATWVEVGGRLWELTTWMPGRADFHTDPSRVRLEAACTALARLHHAWARITRSLGPCPAVRRRLERVHDWAALVASGWHPLEHADAQDSLRPWVEQAWALLGTRMKQMPDRLLAWAGRRLPLQPCLCDIWHDHVLFTGAAVTGLVDFGGAKIDHVTVDLARLLGSLVGDDAAARAIGLEAYRRIRPLSAEEEALVPVLDETGTLLGLANWLRWLYHDGRTFEDRSAVGRRLGELVQRIRSWP